MIFFLQLAFKNVYGARWTNLIHEEWISNLLKNRPDISKDVLEVTKKNMNKRIINCLVNDFEHLMDRLILPDSGDRHVLAAAIECRANAIITFNLKDFPKDILKEFDLEPMHPDEFIIRIAFSSPSLLLESVKEVRERLKSPPVSAKEYLEVLTRQRLVKTVEFLSNYAALI